MTVRWSHWLLGHAAAWQRDDARLTELMPRVATLPLGSGGHLQQQLLLLLLQACLLAESTRESFQPGDGLKRGAVCSAVPARALAFS